MKFAVDCMLGKLAKWLKILGFDTVFFSRIEDDSLLELARAEKRVLLTRDGVLRESAGDEPALMVESEDWRDQLRQVIREFGLRDRIRPWSRCLSCNHPLHEIDRARARNLVPPHVLATARGFALCPVCGRVFWRGTHHADMERRLMDILEEDPERSG